MSKQTLSSDNVVLVRESASSLIAMKGALANAEAFKTECNARIVALHKGKAVIGRYGKCLLATTFKDALISSGLAKGTADNYLSVFREHVKTGEPVEDWNPNRDSKGKGKGKGKGKAKGSKAFDELLAAVFNHDEGKTLKMICADWDKKIIVEDAEFDGIYDCIVDYLTAEGYEITE